MLTLYRDNTPRWGIEECCAPAGASARKSKAMKPGIPWSVKGIEPEAREVAKFAARRSGLTLGEWLNSLILESAEEAPAAPPTSPHSKDDITEKLESLAEQLNALSSPGEASVSPHQRSTQA